MTPAAPLLTAWENFYVIVGSSGAALTGLQFVVMALIAEAQRKGSSDAVNAFGTPTVVHFCAVLATSAVLSAPWPTTFPPAVMLALGGITGIGYATIVTTRAGRQKDYKPVLEDWVFHSILPLLAYASLFVGAITIDRNGGEGLFAIGASTLLLLLVGIHNAWDSVSYVATKQFREGQS